MEPVTHLLASYTLARAARAPALSMRMAVFLCAGLAPDLDWFFHLRPPLSALRAYGTAMHSVLGAAALAAGVGFAGWFVARSSAREKPPLPGLLAAAFAAGAGHLLLDLCSTTGIEFFWPLRRGRIAWNLAGNFDVILIVALAVCALFPALLSLVTEEIGAGAGPREQRAWPAGAGWPLAAILLAVLYMGGRAWLHSRAEEMLSSAQYRGSAPRRWAAYPLGASPTNWRGVVETDTLLAELDLGRADRTGFNPGRAVVHFKPDSSPDLDAATASPLARAYTALARFPAASVEQRPEGALVEIRELGDSPLRSAARTWVASIQLDAQSRVTRQELYPIPLHAP